MFVIKIDDDPSVEGGLLVDMYSTDGDNLNNDDNKAYFARLMFDFIQNNLTGGETTVFGPTGEPTSTNLQ